VSANEIDVDPANNSVTVATVLGDIVSPMLTCPTPIVAEAQSAQGATVTFAVTAADDCDLSVVPVCSPPSGNQFALGTTTVTCCAKDSSGNGARCSFTVTVVEDTTPPVLSCAPNKTVECSSCFAGPLQPPHTVLHAFSHNGGGPFAAVMLGSDGALYGTSLYGGSSDAGMVFRVTPTARVTLCSRASQVLTGHCPKRA
jgi:uncharacterized repeat protein (TIGR03803 family)